MIDRRTSLHCNVLYDAPMKTVAVIGASPHRHKFGNKAVRAFREAGYRVIPITPRHDMVEGERTYASVLDYPDPIDVATVYVPAEIGITLLDTIARKGIGEVWFNPGSESAALLARARTLGIAPITACSILGIGKSPSQF
jgi:predicted CoA-binding protein